MITTDKKSSNLYEEIWGHRLKDGQTSYEYMLEFLNVLKGTNYKFGSSGYFRRKSVALRQFVFKEDLFEQHDGMPKEVFEALTKVLPQDQIKQQFVRNLLRSFAIVERKRSWCVKFLFPVHEELLFVELRSDKRKESLGIERNFFARGGELYYLMLSQANDEAAKGEIAAKVEAILTKSNSAIGEIAKVINETTVTLDDIPRFYDEDSSQAPLQANDGGRDYPYLPGGSCHYYDYMITHVKHLLRANIEETQLLYLLNTLISLHIANYILRRADRSCVGCSGGAGVRCTPDVFVDCYIGGQNPEIRKLSAKQFKRMELKIRTRVIQHLEDRLHQIFENGFTQTRSLIQEYLSVEEDIRQAFYYKSLKKQNKKVIDNLLEKGEKIIESKAKSREEKISNVFNLLKIGLEKVVLSQTDKNFLPIHKAILKEIGLAGYRTGENYRYTLSDNVVKVLVLSLLKPGDKMEFTDFVHEVWNNFGLIIGLREAKEAGIYQESKLNIRYFEENLEQFRDRLRNNGLLREFSDATALVENRYI
jgi:hypothetical protein